MNFTRRRPMAAALAIGLTAALVACGGDDDDDNGGDSGEPVTLQYWGWGRGVEDMIQMYNDSQDTITINWVEQPPGAEAVTNLRNGVAAGNGPCLAQVDGRDLVPLVADQIVMNIDEWIGRYRDDYASAPYSEMLVNDAAYGVPASGNTGFMIYNMAVMDEYDLDIPTTWEEYIAVGEVLAADGIKLTNHAGEDPSGLMNLAWQAGAKWYSIDGDAWRIDFLSQDSMQAADIIQRQIDTDAISTLTYADYDAVMAAFDSGETVARSVSTWQLAGMQNTVSETLGNWKPAPTPEFTGEGLANVGGAGPIVVPEGCAHPEQAVEAAHWLTTDPDAVAYAADPVTGGAGFPAVADPEPYIDVLVPEELMGDYAPEAHDIIVAGADSAVEGWVFGPNFSAMYEELADGWAHVVTGDQTVVELLQHMQEWTVADLRERGINVAE